MNFGLPRRIAVSFALLFSLPLAGLDRVSAGTPDQVQRDVRTAPTSVQMVDALNGVFGAHAFTRANHAHGSMFMASFSPSVGARQISRAPHFQDLNSAVLVRFSTFGGNPDVADADPGAAPYGMSLKFYLPDRSETDLIMHSFNGFPSTTAAEFVDFLHAMAQGPAALDQYAATHPPARAFLQAAKPAPASFASQPYFAVNTFKFTNAAGKISYGRYRMVPETPARYLSAVQTGAAAAAYLQTEMAQRLAAGPVTMRLQLQIAEAGDPLEDPSMTWPENRRIVELGRLTITAPAEQSAERDQAVFLPDELPDGIEPADPMISARTRAYNESLERRVR
ncbi:MAG: catalase family peroxidase [Massilia sp.]